MLGIITIVIRSATFIVSALAMGRHLAKLCVCNEKQSLPEGETNKQMITSHGGSFYTHLPPNGVKAAVRWAKSMGQGLGALRVLGGPLSHGREESGWAPWRRCF